MSNEPPRAAQRPRAFRLTPDAPPAAEPASPIAPDTDSEHPQVAPPPRPTPRRIEIEERPDFYALEAAPEDAKPADERATEAAQRRGMLGRGILSWGGLFWSALGALVSLGVGLWITRLIDELFARVPGLGWLGLALLGLMGLALVALALREIVGVLRQRHVAVLHRRLADAHAADDGKAARAALKDLAGLYASRPETARARGEMETLARDIIDGRDLIDLAERGLMAPLDAQARREIAQAAKRVSVVTAISPRAMLDLVFVVGQTIRLIRKIAEIYSGRPGFLGFVRLARSVAAHLVITGGMAVGDSLLQQVVGHGIASKISARLGEGVLNGLLTTRVGLSAMAVCRPMPFAAIAQPGIAEVAPFLFGDKEPKG